MPAKCIGTASGVANFQTKEYPVASGVTVNSGDFVYLSSGRVTAANVAGVTLLGMVAGKNSADPSDHSTTLSATGNAGGTVKVLVIVDPAAKFVVKNDNDSTTFAASHVGTCFDLIGATGAQLVDTSSTGTTGQLECIQYGYNNDATLGVFIINEHKYKVNA